MLLQRAQRLQCVGDGPAGVRVHADRDPLAHRFADHAEMPGVLLPSVGMAGLDAKNLDAELVQRALGVSDHLLRIRRHADRPFEGNARLVETADQVIDRLPDRFPHGVVKRGVDDGPSHEIRGSQCIEKGVDPLDIEDALSDQPRAAYLLDHRDHGCVGVRHRVMRRQRPDLTVTHDAFGKQLHQHRLAEQRARRAGVVRPGRALPLQPRLKIGDAYLDPLDAHVSRGRNRAFPAPAASPRLRRRRRRPVRDRACPCAVSGSPPRRRHRATGNRS